MEDSPSFNVNNFHTDYKAAVLAAELVEAGFDINRLFIWPSGSNRRNFAKDVLSVDWYAPDGGFKDYLCIKSSREGMYDMLPEGIFHTAVPYSSTRTTEELIDQIKLHKEQEKQARKFFLPLEAEINQFRILIELYENKIDKKNIYNDLVEIFRPGWEIFELLDQQQANIFLHLIPMLHDAKGDLEKLEQVLVLMLQMPVQVKITAAQVRTATTGSILGESMLGVDLVAGNAFLEGDEEVLIQVGPIAPAAVIRLMPGERLEQVVRWLVSYFVPADMEVRLETVITERSMQLEESVLGYTAFI
ncbi:type VI secretion system (T6SS) VasB/ImpH family protein [Chitinophaga dinghuensis]|uniref:Type VI secretion system (T6SS) VasB/ImpH family protein n=1 Tax=Chitinophaga dinghuensis TaxID=1539050 RepID=A0A327WFG9_9BACT|nr:type VI secretion system baseplate subunit TssG [Chitinophaga dinghuensis]RAJ88100.1 type VI secretion system (T6SS) VasB/ImpH family protein [Chitinophaga dinghuensis]